MSDTFCILPWIHIYVNADGSVLPCCIGHYENHMGNVQNDTIENILNGEKYKNMRAKMLRGEKCQECRACYKSEEIGNNSLRKSINKKFQQYIPDALQIKEDGTLDKVKLRYLDVRWSNICNFKCRSCSSTYSSTWAQEDNAQGKRKPIHIFAGGNDNDNLYDQFKPHFKDIKTFYFAGGEPLLTDKHYEILEYLIEHKHTDVEIDYNTNISNLKYKNKSVFDYWPHFKRVEVGASLDSWGKRAEFIREGTDWNTIVKNIKEVRKQCPNVFLNSSSVISAFNVNTIPEFLDSLYKDELFDRDTHTAKFYNIVNPTFFTLSILPDNLRKETIEKLNDSKGRFNKKIQFEINSVISQLENTTYDKELAKQFVRSTQYYDRIRNRNFVETFPEISEIFNEDIL